LLFQRVGHFKNQVEGRRRRRKGKRKSKNSLEGQRLQRNDFQKKMKERYI